MKRKSLIFIIFVIVVLLAILITIFILFPGSIECRFEGGTYRSCAGGAFLHGYCGCFHTFSDGKKLCTENSECSSDKCIISCAAKPDQNGLYAGKCATYSYEPWFGSVYIKELGTMVGKMHCSEMQ
jgi:hypothetical protein